MAVRERNLSLLQPCLQAYSQRPGSLYPFLHLKAQPTAANSYVDEFSELFDSMFIVPGPEELASQVPTWGIACGQFMDFRDPNSLHIWEYLDPKSR